MIGTEVFILPNITSLKSQNSTCLIRSCRQSNSYTTERYVDYIPVGIIGPTKSKPRDRGQSTTFFSQLGKSLSGPRPVMKCQYC